MNTKKSAAFILSLCLGFTAFVGGLPSADGFTGASASITASASSAVGKVVVKDDYASSESKIKISWNKVKNATGYRIYRYNGKKWVKVGQTKATSFKDTGLEPGTEYKYKVKAFIRTPSVNALLKNEIEWGEASEIKYTATKPEAVKMKSTIRDVNSLELTWVSVKCDGYKIYQRIDGKYTCVKTLKGGDNSSAIISGLDKNTKYYFKVRPYVKDKNGKTIYGVCGKKAVTTNGIQTDVEFTSSCYVFDVANEDSDSKYNFGDYDTMIINSAEGLKKLIDVIKEYYPETDCTDTYNSLLEKLGGYDETFFETKTLVYYRSTTYGYSSEYVQAAVDRVSTQVMGGENTLIMDTHYEEVLPEDQLVVDEYLTRFNVYMAETDKTTAKKFAATETEKSSDSSD